MKSRYRLVAIFLAITICAILFAPSASLYIAWSKVDHDLWRHILSTSLGEVTVNTIQLIFVVATASVLVGAPLAWASATNRLPKWTTIGLSIPLLLPKYVLGFAYLSLTDYAGPLQSGLRYFGLDASGWLQTGSLGPIAFSMTMALFPYVFLVVREGLLHLDLDVIDAARLMGAKESSVVFSVALPMVRPWFLSGLSLVILECLTDFGTVAVFNFDTYTTLLYKTWFGLQSFGLTAQLGSLVMTLCMGFFVIQSMLTRRQHRFQTGSVRRLTKEATRPDWRWSCYAAVVVGISFLLPLVYLILLSVELPVWPGGMLDVAMNTAMIAALTALSVWLCSLLFILCCRHIPQRLAMFVKSLTRTGYAIPGIIVATGVLVLINQLADRWDIADVLLTGTVVATVFGLTVKFFIFGQDNFQNRLQQLSPSIEEGARLAGARELHLVKDFYTPLLSRTMALTLLMVFVESAKEMPISLMTRSFGMDTLAIKIFEFTSEGEYGYAAVPSVLLCGLGLIAALALPRFRA